MIAPSHQARVLQVCAAAAVFLTFAYFFLPSSLSASNLTPSTSPWSKAPFSGDAPNNITLDFELVNKLELPSKFTYQRYCIHAHEKRGLHRKSLIELPDDILDPFGVVEIASDYDFTPESNAQSLFPPCKEVHDIDVPEFSSHSHASTAPLMLGVATTIKRIQDSLPTFSRWLSGTGSPLVVLLVDVQNLDKEREEIRRVSAAATALDIDLIFEPYHPLFSVDSEGLKNFGLATVLDRNRRDETKWFGIIDDDTFFLSLPRMLEALAPYDPEQEWYIGALTEGHTRVAQEGFKAWGGAGFFVSPPLMKILAENAVECAPLDKSFGDILWRDCILQVTSPTVHLTEMRGLNQMDLWHDISGWYEAGFNPIHTVHHWKSWHYFPISLSHLVTDVAGPDSLFQRYQFGNKTVFTNGYSMVEYPRGVPDLNLVELTMTEDVNIERPPAALEFHHSMGKTRPAMKLGKDKISWTLEHAVKTADGTIRQFYIKRTNSRKEASIIEIDWRHG